MPRGMEVHLVDAVAKPIVGMELRRVLVRLEAPGDRLLGAGELPELAHPAMSPAGAFALEGLAQGRVSLKKVVVDQRRRLVEGLSQLLRPARRQGATAAYESRCQAPSG